MSFMSRLSYALMYLQRPPWESGITPPELLEFLNTIPAGSAIDLGCGTGTNSITLSKMGWLVTGIDFVPCAIRKARKKSQLAGQNLDFRIGDVTHLDGIVGPFDLALDLGCFHTLAGKEKSAYLHELKRLLRPGGTWFVYGFVFPAGSPGDSGITLPDLELIQENFVLISRLNGYDHGDKPSAYFILKKMTKGFEKAGKS